MNIRELRNMFPALSRTVYGKQLVYFDNAATAQRSQSVIDKWTQLTIGANANIHRAVHKLAVDATDEYESTRDAVKEYINAAAREEIVFTSGTTGSINLVAFSFGETFVNKGDEIIVSESEHHSNIVPWQMLCQRKGAVLRVLHVDEDGHLNLEELKSLLNPKTRIVAVTQISNVLGILNPVKEIVSICHSVGCPVLSMERRVWFTKVLTFRMLIVTFTLFPDTNSMRPPEPGYFTGNVSGWIRWFLIRAVER